MTKLSRSKFLNSAALLLASAAFGMTGCNAPALSGNASEEQTQDAASTADSADVSNPDGAALYASCLEIAAKYKDLYTQAFDAGSLDTRLL